MLLKFSSARLSDNIKRHQPGTPCPAVQASNVASDHCYGNGALLFQGFLKGNIRVANPTNDNVV